MGKYYFQILAYYFNPRSHERSDTNPSSSAFMDRYFNPRSHERSDFNRLLRVRLDLVFQSTLPREERPFLLQLKAQVCVFQSTLPREERRCHSNQHHIQPYFNPRSHERSDDNPIVYCCYKENFNPRSHERSDFLKYSPYSQHCISIHAPTRGATIGYNCTSYGKLISIHAPTRGATIFLCADCQPINIFQSTLPREERHN